MSFYTKHSLMISNRVCIRKWPTKELAEEFVHDYKSWADANVCQVSSDDPMVKKAAKWFNERPNRGNYDSWTN